MFNFETAPLTYPPYECMVTGRDDGEIVVFDADILPYFEGEPPRIQIKADVIEEVARELGMVSRSEVDAMKQQVAEWGAAVTAALDQHTTLQEFQVNFTENLNSY